MKRRSWIVLCVAVLSSCVRFPVSIENGTLHEPISGTYYLPGVLEARNIMLHENGSYTYDIWACDSAGVDRGTVEYQSEFAAELISSIGLFNFPVEVIDGGTINENTETVRVSMTQSGELVTAVGEKRLIWLPGRTCTLCQFGGTGTPLGIELCDCFSPIGGERVEGVPPCDEAP